MLKTTILKLRSLDEGRIACDVFEIMAPEESRESPSRLYQTIQVAP